MSDIAQKIINRGVAELSSKEQQINTNISESEKFLNIFQNAGRGLQQAFYSTQVIGLQMSNYLGLGNDYLIDDLIKEKYSDIEELNKKMEYTGKGIVGGFKDGDISDIGLGITNALTSVVTSVVPAMLTRGASLVPQIAAPMYTEYNMEKAKVLYGEDDVDASVKKLLDNNEDEVLAPVVLGLTAAALERVGYKGITNYMLDRAKTQGVKRIIGLVSTGNREGLTEYFQGGLNTANKSLARGENPVPAFFNHLTSEQGLEEYLQGFVGGTGMSSAGKAISNAIRSDKDNLIINEYIQELSNLQQQKVNSKTAEAKVAIDKKIKKAEQDFKDFLIENQKRSKFITKEQSEDLINILKTKQKLNKKLTKFEDQFRNGEISQNEFNTIVEDINNDIKAENKKAEEIRIEANKKFLMDDLRTSETAINKILGLEQKVYKTEQEFLDAYNAKTGKNLTLNDIEGVDGVKIGDEIMINAEAAAKNNAVTVGSHELLHGILKSSLTTGELRNVTDKDGNIVRDANGKIVKTDLTEEGEQLIKDFLNTLNSKEKKVIQKRIDDNYKFNKDGSEKQFSQYAEEYLNAYADAAIKNELTDNVLVKIGKFLSKIFNKGDKGYKNLEFKTGQDVKAFLKAYVSDRKKGEFRQQFVEMAQEGAKKDTVVETKRKPRYSDDTVPVKRETFTQTMSDGKKVKYRAITRLDGSVYFQVIKEGESDFSGASTKLNIKPGDNITPKQRLEAIDKDATITLDKTEDYKSVMNPKMFDRLTPDQQQRVDPKRAKKTAPKKSKTIEKKSLSSAARQQISDSIKEIGNTYSFEGGKKAWDEGGADNAITEIKQNNYLDDLIAAKFKGDRVPIDFVDKVYTELTSHIRNFNPETNDNLFGWINSQLANKAGNVYNREYKTTTEQRTAKDVDDRTKEGEVKVQVAAEEDISLQELEEKDISPQAEARRKREAAKKEEPTKSQLRQEIGIEDGSDAYNTVLETARKVLIRAYDAGKTARQIQRDLTKEASTYLFKQVKNMLGTKAKYIPTIKKLRVALVNSMFTADLVQMERNVADDQRVFTKFVGKLTSKQEVQDAVDNNLLPPSALNTIDKGQSVNLYEKVMPTEEQFVAFFDQPLVNPKTGVRSGLRGTRKDQLAKHVAASLNFDATMQVAQEPEIMQKRKDIAELKNQEIITDDIQQLSTVINRDLNLKFHKTNNKNFSKKQKNQIKLGNKIILDIDKAAEINNIILKDGSQIPILQNLSEKDAEKYGGKFLINTVIDAFDTRDIERVDNVVIKKIIFKNILTPSGRLKKGAKFSTAYEQFFISLANSAVKELQANLDVNLVVREGGFPDVGFQKGDTIIGLEIKMDQSRGVSYTYRFDDTISNENTKNQTEQEDLIKQIKSEIAGLPGITIEDLKRGVTPEQYMTLKVNKSIFNKTVEVDAAYLEEHYTKKLKPEYFINIGDAGLFYMLGKEGDVNNSSVKKIAQELGIPRLQGKFQLNSVMSIGRKPRSTKGNTHDVVIRVQPRIDSKDAKNFPVKSNLNLSNKADMKLFVDSVSKQINNFTVEKQSKSVRNARPVLKYSKTSRGMSAFDFDETLIDKGENFIIATSPDGDQIKISSGQWPIQGPELSKQGYTFDFKDFVNVRGGVDGPLLQKLKNRIQKYGAKNNYILTARPAESATAIHGWLKTKGINIPLENITGLGNSTGEAKAMWIAGKYSEGYNDIYFVDDALPNVEAVQNVLNQLDVKGKSVQAKIKFSKSIKNTLNKNKSYVKFKNSLKNSVFYHGGLSSLKNKNAVWFIVDDVDGAEVYSNIRGVTGEVYSVKASQLKDSIIIPDVNDSIGFDKIIKQKFPDQVKALVDDTGGAYGKRVTIEKILKQDNAAEIISEYMNWANNNFELFEGVYGPETLYDNNGKIAKSLPVIVLDTDVSSKAKEVKPSIKFSKSSLRGNKTVKNVFNQLDIKGKSVQAKIKFSKSLNKDFNDIIEDVKGIDSKKRFSEAKGRARGKGKGRFRFFIPPSHEDFVGLLYNFIGFGEKGNKHRDFFEKALIRPLNRAYRELNVAKQAIANDYRALVKGMPEVRKRLGEKILKGDYTVEDAIRVYLFNKAGYEVPGLTKTDLKNLVEFVKSDPMIQSFADTVGEISRVEEGYVSPGDSWQASNIRYDLVDATGRVGRAKFFAEYQENADIIFSDENMNKIRAAFGDNFVEALKDMLHVNKTGSNRPTGNNRIVNRFLDWVNGSVGATMFFNARSAVLQTLSTVNFINFGDNNIFKAAAAFANQKQYWSDFVALFNSDFLKQRRSGAAFDVNANEIAREVAGSKNPMLAAIKYLLNIGFLPTQLADSFAIASGGATFYRNRIKTYLKQGLSQKEAESKAFIDFQEIAEATQQSARPDMVSQQQRSPLGRVILAFQNVTAQYARIIKKSGLDLINRRISKGYTSQAQSDAANISRIIYYGAIQSIIFNALQNALFAMMFDEDEEDEEKTKKFFETKKQRVINGTIDSILKGSGVGGAIISTLKNYAIKLADNLESKSFYKTPAWEELLQLSPPIGIKIRKIARAERNLEWNKDVLTELPLDNLDNPIYDISTAYIEGFTNIPVARLLRKVQNISAALDSENKWWQRIAVGAGWSRWDVGITDDEIRETKKAIRENNKRVEKEIKLKKATPEEKLKIIEKEVFDLNKREQEKILENNNLNPKDYKLEKDRVEAIMKLRVKNEKNIDKQISDIKNYVPTKNEQRSIDLFKMNKKDQVNMLIDLGLSSKQIKELKYEEDRVNKIIELQDKKKSKKR